MWAIKHSSVRLRNERTNKPVLENQMILIKWFFILLYAFISVVAVIGAVGMFNGAYVELTKVEQK